MHYRIALIGNPNVGKSALFSRLTGTHVLSGNYPGTTLSVIRGRIEDSESTIKLSYEIIDMPGFYSLTETTHAAQQALVILSDADCMIAVLDATRLKRQLFLIEQLRQLGRPLIVVLNLSDEARAQGIEIDADKLSQALHCPVIPTVSITGEGIIALKEKIAQACQPSARTTPLLTAPLKLPDWDLITSIHETTETRTERIKTYREYCDMLTLNPFWGTGIAIGILALTFFLVFFISELMEESVLSLFEFVLTQPLLMLHTLLRPFPLLQNIIVGSLVDGTIDFEQSLGLLSTGLYIPLGQVMPPVTAFYLIMGILEDCGYLPRLAILSDTLLHRYALHGFALIPMVLGAGCNVTGIIGTRLLDNKRQRMIAAFLLSMTIPCASQTGFIAAMADRIGGWYILLLLTTLAVLWHTLGRIIGAYETDKNYQELCMAIPPLRLPRLKPSLHKLRYRVVNFLSDAIPFTICGIGIVLALHYSALLERFGTFSGPLLTALWGLPASLIPALCIGLFRKEIALSFLRATPGLSAEQSFIATLLLVLWFPCVSVYSVMYKEFGLRPLLLMTGAMLLLSTTIAWFFKLILL